MVAWVGTAACAVGQEAVCVEVAAAWEVDSEEAWVVACVVDRGGGEAPGAVGQTVAGECHVQPSSQGHMGVISYQMCCDTINLSNFTP